MTEPTVIAFVGAGSVVFTRDLVADLLRMSDLGPAGAAAARHRHRAARDRRGARGPHRRRSSARSRRSPATSTGARRSTAPTSSSTPSRSVASSSTRTDFEVPARFGLNQTIADTIGIGGIFRALRTFPVLDGIAADMLDVCPDAWLLNYTNPMAMNIAYLGEVAPTLKVVGHVPLGLLDRRRPLRHRRGAAWRRSSTTPPASTTRPGCCAGSTKARASTRCWTQRSRPTPSSVAGCASTCTGASATTRPRPASTPPSTSPGTCTTPARSSASASRWATTWASARRTSASTRPRARNCSPTSRSRSRARPSTPRRSSTPSSPATKRAHLRHRPRTRASSPTCPTGPGSRCRPCSTPSGCSRSTSVTSPPSAPRSTARS